MQSLGSLLQSKNSQGWGGNICSLSSPGAEVSAGKSQIKSYHILQEFQMNCLESRTQPA